MPRVPDPATALLVTALLSGCASAPPPIVANEPPPAPIMETVLQPAAVDWPSYNRTVSSERFTPLSQINTSNVSGLKAVCTYDLGVDVSFQTGPIVVGRTLYGTTDKETFAIDAATCAQTWRIKEDSPDTFLKVNRGVAYLDGRLFRGLHDGTVVAYDASGGRKLWVTKIANPAAGESIPAAPIAWNGMVFIGPAGGDNKGVKGRIYALDAATGRQLWETYLVPREEAVKSAPSPIEAKARPTWGNTRGIPITGGATWTSYTLDPESGLLYVPGGNPAPDFVKGMRPGANLFANSIVVLDARTGSYQRYFSLVPEDFHDWDVAAAPALAKTRGGRRVMAAAPKDGFLYGYDLASGQRIYQTAVTRRENTEVALSRKSTRFCPGSQGGTEWNGPAYSPDTNLIYTGSVDWCTTVRVADPTKIASVAFGQPWSGMDDEKNAFGIFDPKEQWGGWISAVDADTGEVRWKFRTPAPVLAAVTPTSGGLIFAADMDAHAYAFEAASGKILWQTMLDGSAGGGVITYSVDGRQYVAFVAGNNSPIWPVDKKTAKIVVFAIP